MWVRRILEAEHLVYALADGKQVRGPSTGMPAIVSSQASENQNELTKLPLLYLDGEIYQEVERMPPEYVIKAEKEKEKRRRERKREEQQALQVLPVLT